MIRIPMSGMAASVRVHNCDLAVACDWIESWVLFCDEEVSWSDIRDVLLEQQVYRDQDFADEFIASMWRELRQRITWLEKSSPIRMEGDRLTPKITAKEAVAYAFMLTVSLAPHFREWSKHFGADYTLQGELFERLVEDAFSSIFPGWIVYRTGWSTDNTSKLSDVLNKLAEAIGAGVGDIEKWASARANECGLDLVCFRQFADSRPAIPIYLAQCATGSNWTHKLDTPNTKTWSRLIEFPQTPGKIFAIPFALDSRGHFQRSNHSDAVLLDRYRLLYAGESNAEWQSQTFRSLANQWLEPRIEWLRDD
ncbi:MULTISPECIES: hypothetical protein [unclassified Thiocapsa]|uniref:hypothetical protein n=1 Tax=unclassified Thiocapsa TaxID=2641286 RepID=UPI0035AE0ACC